MPASAPSSILTSRIAVEDLHLQITESGRAGLPAILLLHGWPQDASAWRGVQRRLAPHAHVIAVDLPGIDGSKPAPPSGEKRLLAGYVRGLMDELKLKKAAVVGHGVGGMLAYACLREFPERITRAVIANAVVPGVEPWDKFYADPNIWHWRLHAVDGLPEVLMAGREAAYFGWFFRSNAKEPARIDATRYAKAYDSANALKASFDWYRAFQADAKANREPPSKPITVPTLVLRAYADHAAAPEEYVEGLKRSGLLHVEAKVIHDTGHFMLDEQPEAVASVVQKFVLGG